MRCRALAPYTSSFHTATRLTAPSRGLSTLLVRLLARCSCRAVRCSQSLQARAAAGYGWQAGWYAQVVLELASLDHSSVGLWTALVSLALALAGFAWTLLRLYRCTAF